jgi:hypothetical protein
MPEWLTQWLAGAALAVTTGLAGAFWRMHVRQNSHAERLAVLEQTSDVQNVRSDIKAMRDHIDGRTDRIYEQIEKVRLELKADIAAKADK